MDTREVKERVIPERRSTDVERASLDFITAEIEAGMRFASAAATQYKRNDNERVAESEARAAYAYLRAESPDESCRDERLLQGHISAQESARIERSDR
jgi:hypothetical protein